MAVAVPSPRTLEQTAELVGHHAWVDERLFELLGRWAVEVPEPEAKLHLATHGHRHGWHADLWRERLPDTAHHPAPAMVRPPAGAEAVLAAVEGQEGTVARLAALYRAVVPRRVVALTDERRACTAVADAPVARVLDLVRRDLVDEWRAGEEVLQSLLTSAALVDEAAAGLAAVERAVVAGRAGA